MEEGVLDAWVAEWIKANPLFAEALEDLSPERVELARGPYGGAPTRSIAQVEDEDVQGIPIRIYVNDDTPTGIAVYFHGGGFVVGSIGLMDNVARELAYVSGAVVVSVGYRLAPEDPYPAGLNDCVTVTRWAIANAGRFGVPPDRVVVTGESAGGNLSAAVALRLRDAGENVLAGQVLLYPATSGSAHFPSKAEFDGIILSGKSSGLFWDAYRSGKDLDQDPYAAPLSAETLKGLPPALVVLGGCDMLRDEGRAYVQRLREDGVEVEDVCMPGQPHGFINFGFPAADEAFRRIGQWLRARFA